MAPKHRIEAGGAQVSRSAPLRARGQQMIPASGPCTVPRGAWPQWEVANLPTLEIYLTGLTRISTVACALRQALVPIPQQQTTWLIQPI